MKQFPITHNDADQRLDKFLKKLFPNATRSLIYKLNRKDKVKIIQIGWKKTKQDNEYKIQVGEIVQIYLKEEDFQELQAEKQTVVSLPVSQKLWKTDIVFEDGNLLVVNKSSGLNVHPGDHKSEEVSLIEQVQDYLWEKLSSLTFKPSLIHRIDRDTSGIVMIAKDKQTLTKLSADFKKKEAIQKTYFAIVLWKLSRNEWTIKKNLDRLENAHNQNKVQVSDSGKEAITHYRVLEEFSLKIPEGEQIISTVEVMIETGRMHQIRVHLAHIWNPILWDKTYGNSSLNGYFAKNYGVSRQMLHAWKIEFFHPVRNKKMSLIARLKEDMEGFLNIFKK